MLESARSVRREILGLLARGRDVLVFPEGTRKNIPRRETYGDFFPAAFEPLLEYERHKQRILAENPGVRALDSYIVPFNVDYSRVREADEMVRPGAAAPQTLGLADALTLLRRIGDTYLTFDRPVRVAELIELDRKELAAACRQRCLELVKILPINVASLAMLELDRDALSPERLHEAVRLVVGRLRRHAERFRGFAPDDAPAEILRRAANRALSFERFEPAQLPQYRLYAAYVRHLL
jgi:1-acyl-sn-glycerol-3-phosphate acyltransferase